MRYRIVFVVCGVTALIGAALLGGVSFERHLDRDHAGNTAERFADAFARRDTEGISGTLTSRGRQAGSFVVSGSASTGDIRQEQPADSRFTTQSVEIQGDLATAKVIEIGSAEKPAIVRMRREAGNWRVYGVTEPVAGGLSEITLDFEHPESNIAEVMRASGEVTGRALGALAKGLEQGAKAFDAALQESQKRASESH